MVSKHQLPFHPQFTFHTQLSVSNVWKFRWLREVQGTILTTLLKGSNCRHSSDSCLFGIRWDSLFFPCALILLALVSASPDIIISKLEMSFPSLIKRNSSRSKFYPKICIPFFIQTKAWQLSDPTGKNSLKTKVKTRLYKKLISRDSS